MRWIAAKFVPPFSNNEQRDHRVQVCTELQNAVRHDPNFMSRVITGDESWLYDYDPETKRQPSQWKTPSSPRPKKARQVRSNIESMLIFFWGGDVRGIVHKEFVPPGQTPNGKFYCEVLTWLGGKIWGANELRCGRTETGCCTMTMRLHTPRLLWGKSWQKITWPLFPTLPTHLIWTSAISTCSLNWNSGWNGGVSYPLTRSKQNGNRH